MSDTEKEKRGARGKSARRKGGTVERKVVNRLNEMVFAERVPLSGGTDYAKGDVELACLGGLRMEIKSRKNGEGFLMLDAWLADNDLLVLNRNRAEDMIVMRWEIFERFLRAIGAGKPDPTLKPGNPRKVAVVCPPTWFPQPEDSEMARKLGVDPRREAAAMIDWSVAGGKKKLDWDATFRNWVRRKAESNGTAPRAPTPPPKNEWGATRARQ